MGSLGFLSLSGLSAFVQSFAVFLRGWWTPSDLPIWKPIIAMLAYEIAALGFGIASIVRGIRSRDPGIILLAAWVFISIFLALVYPGKMTIDISWTILPLWILAAMELSKHTDLNNLQPLGTCRHDHPDRCSVDIHLVGSRQPFQYGSKPANSTHAHLSTAGRCFARWIVSSSNRLRVV